MLIHSSTAFWVLINIALLLLLFLAIFVGIKETKGYINRSKEMCEKVNYIYQELKNK